METKSLSRRNENATTDLISFFKNRPGAQSRDCTDENYTSSDSLLWLSLDCNVSDMDSFHDWRLDEMRKLVNFDGFSMWREVVKVPDKAVADASIFGSQYFSAIQRDSLYVLNILIDGRCCQFHVPIDKWK